MSIAAAVADHSERGRASRQKMVALANAIMTLNSNGVTPSKQDREIQRKFIDGTAALGDLLKVPHLFVRPAK